MHKRANGCNRAGVGSEDAWGRAAAVTDDHPLPVIIGGWLSDTPDDAATRR